MKLMETNLPKSTRVTNGLSFEIHTIQWMRLNRGYEDKIQQSKDRFHIIWITMGEGRLLVDLQKIDFENNQLFFIKQGQVYQFQLTADIEGYVISFTDSFLSKVDQENESICQNSLFQLFVGSGGIKINEETSAEMNDITGRMIREFTNLHLFRDELLRRYLKIFLIYLSRQLEGALMTVKQTRNIELTQKFMSLVDKHFKTEKMVSGYATLLSIRPNYLNEIVKKTTGYSAGHHIRQRIVLEAKRRAAYSDTCMKQIGYYLGFNDMAHFSKFFKSATGMNFTDFKKEKLVFAATP